MSTIVKDLGIVTAYAYAVAGGYTGTEEQFKALMYSYTTAGDAADVAVAAAAEAETYAEMVGSALLTDSNGKFYVTMEDA